MSTYLTTSEVALRLGVSRSTQAAASAFVAKLAESRR